MKKIVIVNFHSTLNSGDAAILLGHVRILEAKYENVQLTVASRTPIRDGLLSDFKHIRFLPPLIPTPVIFLSGKNRIRENLINLFSLTARYRLIRSIRKSDLVISCGGTNFFSNRRLFPGPMFFQNMTNVLAAFMFRKTVIFSPQSFGPFRNRLAAVITGWILKSPRVEKIYAREEISLEIIRRLPGAREKSSLCPDLAFHLEPGDLLSGMAESDMIKKPIVALALRNWKFPGTVEKEKVMLDRYRNAIIRICRRIIRDHNGTVLFVAGSRAFPKTEDDRIITARLIREIGREFPAERIRFCGFGETDDFKSLVSCLARADLLISTRFHPSIFSLILGIPVITIAYHHKSDGIMKMINLEDSVYSISGFSIENLIDLTDRILGNPDEIRAELIPKVQAVKERLSSRIGELF